MDRVKKKKKEKWWANLDTPQIEPQCRYFGVCGGCKLQHIDPKIQIQEKEKYLKKVLLDELDALPEETLSTISGNPWHYRYRANLSAKHVKKKESVLVGFREKKKQYVADIENCLILPKKVSNLILPLRHLIQKLSIHEHLPQINVSCGDKETSLVIRHLKPITEEDRKELLSFEKEHGISLCLQPDGLDSIHLLDPKKSIELNYRLPEFELTFSFHPAQFTQINPEINQIMVRRAVELLEPKQGERIADMFCGIGNFSLPLARSGAQITGIEFNESQIITAGKNAEANRLSETVEFKTMNLDEISEEEFKRLLPIQKMLIDPPRTGALSLVSSISGHELSKILYISCNPLTLARDAKILIESKGYSMEAYGLIDMFPQTGHMEAMALFVRS